MTSRDAFKFCNFETGIGCWKCCPLGKLKSETVLAIQLAFLLLQITMLPKALLYTSVYIFATCFWLTLN